MGSGVWQVMSGRLAGGKARGPGPLEIEAAEVARHIDDLADEVETRDPSGFECL